jgi:hypothetical protein
MSAAIRWIFESVTYYYPALIPIFLAIITVLHRIASADNPEHGKLLTHVFKLYTDLTLGLFGFVLWAYGTTGFGSGMVQLNNDYYIKSAHVNILLLFDIALVILTTWVARYEWKGNKRHERMADVTMLAVTIVFVTIPISLKQPYKTASAPPPPPRHHYHVMIPYRDPSLFANLVSPKVWGERRLCWAADITASDEDAVTQLAQRDFAIWTAKLRFPARSAGVDGLTVESPQITRMDAEAPASRDVALAMPPS